MNKSKKAATIIEMLKSRNFHAECPCCQEPLPLRGAGLFYLDNFTDEAERLYQKRLQDMKERAQSLKKLRKSISLRSGSYIEVR
jgi:hypothetical protein